VHLPALAVAYRQALSGVISEALCPSAGVLAPDQSKLVRPGSVGWAAPAIRQGVGRSGLICLPPQEPRDALAFAFLVDRGPSGPHMRRRGSGWARGPPPPFQRPILVGVGSGPRQTSGLGPAPRRRHRGPPEAEALGHLASAEPLAPWQSSHVVSLTPGEPLCRHLLLPHEVSKVQATDRFAQRRTAPQPYAGWQRCRGSGGSFRLASMAGLLWHQWQLSCGTGGSVAVESVAGCTWNRWQLCRGIRRWAAHAALFACAGITGHTSLYCLHFNPTVADDNGLVFRGVRSLETEVSLRNRARGPNLPRSATKPSQR
jgi:hypothetical protein